MKSSIAAMIAVALFSACKGKGPIESQPGASSRIRQVAPDGECPNGGVVIESGIDSNRDGELEDDEVDTIDVVCHGSAGVGSLVSVTGEPAGANCASGGQRLDSGLDVDGDGVLSAAEVTSTTFVCNGSAGAAGVISLVDVTPVEAAECERGGFLVESGVDDDGDGVLDALEIDATQLICNGADGSDGVTPSLSITDELAGENCQNGGKRIEAYVDLDGDGALSPGEATSTAYVCHGDAGLVSVEPEAPGANCLHGGLRVEAGSDVDADGILADGEVTAIAYQCVLQSCTMDYECADPAAVCADGWCYVDPTRRCAPEEEGSERPCERVNGYGACSGVSVCAAGAFGECGAPTPAAEICADERDNDCDGLLDGLDACADVSCTPAESQSLMQCLLECGGDEWCAQFCVMQSGASELCVTALFELSSCAQSQCPGAGDPACIIELCRVEYIAVFGSDGLPPECTPGDLQSCGSDVGECVSGTRTCLADSTFGPCDNAVPPAPEACDGLDNDCDGLTDLNPEAGGLELFYDFDRDGYGSEPVIACAAIVADPAMDFDVIAQGGDCADWEPAINPAASPVCEPTDWNCNGLVDTAELDGCAYCGDWYCELAEGESVDTCPEDCPTICGRCDDGDACTIDACDEGTAVCTFQALTCDDGVACTIESCDPAFGCFVAVDDASCDDGLPETYDLCRPGSPLANATGCANAPMNVCGNGVLENEEYCDDGNADETDGCTTGCQPSPSPCGPYDDIGCCSGDVLVYCFDGQVYSQQCAPSTCGWREWERFYDCEVEGGTSDPSGQFPLECAPPACGDGTCVELLETAESCAIDCAVPCGGCDDGNACTDDVCDLGTDTCIYSPRSCEDGFPCTEDLCDPASGCTWTGNDEVCVDADAGTYDICNPYAPGADEITGCTHTPANVCGNGLVELGEQCDDANADDTDGCTTSCTLTQSSCGPYTFTGCCTGDVLVFCDGDLLQTVSCGENQCGWSVSGYYDCGLGGADPAGEMPRECPAAVCGDGFCAPVQETSEVCPEDCGPSPCASCDDGDACTVDSCDAYSATCYSEPTSCDDGNACTLETCEPVTGCGSVPVSCEDGYACTVDSCDAVFGCGNAADDASCDDIDPDTVDLCAPDAFDAELGTGCVHRPANVCGNGVVEGLEHCDDGNPDDSDGCTTRCRPTPPPCGPYLQQGCCAGDVLIYCDGAQVHSETCGAAQCGWSSRAELYDCGHAGQSSPYPELPLACPAPVCGDGECFALQESVESCPGDCGVACEGCDDGDACTLDSCDALTGGCSHAPSCDDGNLCTADSCDPDTGACTSTPLDCDDARTCTMDVCDAFVGCLSITSDAYCDDGDGATYDFCDPSAAGASPMTGCISRAVGVCGNGVPEGSEQCDDGNADETDGCTTSCTPWSTTCGPYVARGCCVGDVLVFCAGGGVSANACQSDECGWDASSAAYACGIAGSPSSPEAQFPRACATPVCGDGFCDPLQESAGICAVDCVGAP